MLLSGTFNARSNNLRGEEAVVFSSQTIDDERSPANNIFSPEKQEPKNNEDEEEDEEENAEELKRIERILKEQRKH
jgi:hypothetical protein